MNHLKENLIELRTEKNFTQYDMARILNITQSTYNHYEKGIREPNIDTLIKLAKLFDITLDELIL